MLFQPDPVLVNVLYFKTYAYPLLLALLAAARVVVGPGLARWPALIALALASGALFTALAPALGQGDSALYRQLARITAGAGSLTALIVPSVIFLISSLIPRARWRWLDWTHLGLFVSLLGIWHWFG
ncbi:MAG: hypothetical protein N4A53_03565 [Pelagimonas sp.]|jgi:hypothetical protein|nr:hypothetical protein [Pelagimonas sp.]